jgi:DNA-directed RNA polymerase specialized sigma24 family protein
MSFELANSLMGIAQGIVSRRNFSGYSYAADLVGESLLAMVKAVEKFDTLGDSSPHAYLTRCAWNAILKTISRESKQDSIRSSVLALGISSSVTPFTGPWPHDDDDQSSLPPEPPAPTCGPVSV